MPLDNSTVIGSSWDDYDDSDDDDTTDLSECGIQYDDGHSFACELIGSEQCEFCPNRYPTDH